jgi:hypothetical protein
LVLKLLLALIVLLSVAFIFLYRRARPYLFIAREIYRLFRRAQQASINQTRDERETFAATRGRTRSNAVRRSQNADALLRCATCGKWTPASQTIKIQNTTFCSHACLEKAAENS